MSPRIPKVAFAALCVLGACSPVVTHSPRVRPGPEVTLTAGTIRELCDTPCDHGGVLPRFGAGARVGWLSRDSAGIGVLAGVAFPAFDLSSPEIEVYLQPPAGPRAPVGGIGALVSTHYAMPYAQIGYDPPTGPGAYATLAHTWFFSHPQWVSDTPGDTTYRAPRYFSPSVSVRLPMRGGGAMSLYLAGAFGSFRETRREYVDGGERIVTDRFPIRLLMTGVTFDVAVNEIFEGFPRFPPGRPRPPVPPFPN